MTAEDHLANVDRNLANVDRKIEKARAFLDESERVHRAALLAQPERPPVTAADIYRPTGKRLPESRWTQPCPFCTHPQHWSSQDADSTEWEVSEMIGGLIRGLQPEVVVETGSAWGQTTKVIGRVLHSNGHGHCYSLEPDAERAAFARWYCHNEISTGVVSILEEESLSFTPPEGSVDFLFADSLFSLRGPELAHFRQWMDLSAFACAHDTAPNHGRVGEGDLQASIEAVPGYRSIRLHTPRGITLMVPI